MPDTKLETMEPDPAATSISNDQTVNKSGSPEEKEQPSTETKVDVPATGDVEVPTDAPTKDTIASETKVETTGNAVEASGDKEEKPTSPQKRRHEEDGRSNKPFKKAKRGNFFDPTVQDVTDDPFAIRKQVEFYFSDANLARDKFLFEKVGGSQNTPVEIAVIHSFKRMRRFQPFEAVIKALKESDILEVVDDDKLKRRNPLPVDFENKTLEEITKASEDESMVRSVYVKGFGYEKPSTQFDIEAWFSNHGTTNQVRLRRLNDKTFKGSVFAEFDTEETAKKFLALDPKPKYQDRDLIIESKKKYLDEKAQAIKDGVIKPDGNGGFRRTDRDNRKDDDRDWRERREQDRKNGFKGGRGGYSGSRGRGRGGRGGFGRGGRDRDGGRDSNKDGKQEGEEAKLKEGKEEAKTEASKPEAEASV